MATAGRQNWVNEWLKTKINPLLTVAGAGQVATGEVGAAGTKTAEQIRRNALFAGQARGEALINQANVWTGARNAAMDYYNAYKFYDYLKAAA